MIVKYFWLTCEFVAYTTKGKQPSTIKTPGIGTESARHVGRNASRFFGAAVCWNAFIRWYFVALNNHGFWQKRGFFLCCNGLRAMGGGWFSLFYENTCSRIAPSSSPSYSDLHFSNFSKKIFNHIHFHFSISFSFFGEYLCLSRFFSLFLFILFSF